MRSRVRAALRHPRATDEPGPGLPRRTARGDDRGMTPPLPLPVRVAAGLVATAVEQARDLPRLALELPVTAVSQALQASMRVQQKVTELAIKGDRVLGVGPPIEDEPAWATFDDDAPAAAQRPRRRHELRRRPTDAAAGRPARRRPARSTGAGPPPTCRPTSRRSAPERADRAAGADRTATPTDGPPVLPGYGALTIPQLRGKLRHLGVDDLRALLAWEQAHGDRPPYVTMLSNRIAAVTEG